MEPQELKDTNLAIQRLEHPGADFDVYRLLVHRANELYRDPAVCSAWEAWIDAGLHVYVGW